MSDTPTRDQLDNMPVPQRLLKLAHEAARDGIFRCGDGCGRGGMDIEFLTDIVAAVLREIGEEMSIYRYDLNRYADAVEGLEVPRV